MEMRKAGEVGMTLEEAIEILEEVKAFDDSMYAYNPAYSEAIDLAIEALKAQQPRVMTMEEVRSLDKDAVVWYEHEGVFRQPRPRVVEFVLDEHITFTDCDNWSVPVDGYGERWRLWTSRPTDEKREATPWAGTTTGEK